MTILGLEKQELEKRILAWFEQLDKRRGSRAELRRAPTPTDAASCIEAWRFVAALGEVVVDDRQRLAEVAGLLVRFREHKGPESLAVQMAGKDEQPKVSVLRFRRLLSSPDRAALYSGLRRMIPLLGHEGNLVDVVDAYVNWEWDRKRIEWARQYYEVILKNETKGASK